MRRLRTKYALKNLGQKRERERKKSSKTKIAVTPSLRRNSWKSTPVGAINGFSTLPSSQHPILQCHMHRAPSMSHQQQQQQGHWHRNTRGGGHALRVESIITFQAIGSRKFQTSEGSGSSSMSLAKKCDEEAHLYMHIHYDHIEVLVCPQMNI